MRNTGKGLDQTQWTVAKELHASGYNTAVVGKWHLKTTPVGFDHWEIFSIHLLSTRDIDLDRLHLPWAETLGLVR